MPKAWKQDLGDYEYHPTKVHSLLSRDAAEQSKQQAAKEFERHARRQTQGADVSLLEMRKAAPKTLLQEYVQKKGMKLQFQPMLDKDSDGSDKWVCGLEITQPNFFAASKRNAGSTDIKVVSLTGRFARHTKEQAMNRICTQALFKLRDRHLWERLPEPYLSDFKMWRENKKLQRETLGPPPRQAGRRSGAAAGRLDTTDLEDLADDMSTNTGFTCATSDVSVAPTKHFAARVVQRRVPLLQQQLCLKYGDKEDVGGGATAFSLGDVCIIQGGKHHGDVAVTVYRKGHVFSGGAGDRMKGLVKIVHGCGRYGFIVTTRGELFFHVGDTVKQVMPDVGDCVKFKVAEVEPKRFKAKEVVVVDLG